MSDHYTIKLRGPADLERVNKMAAWAAGQVGKGWTIIVTKRRGEEQSARWHAMIDDLVAQADWHGIKLDKESWKDVMIDGWLREKHDQCQRLIPGWHPGTILGLGQRSRSLTVEQMSELIDFTDYAGGVLGVTFREK